MQLEIWHISGDGFHFGRHGLGQEESAAHLTSDTLFSALVTRLAALDGQPAVEEWIQPFVRGQPPFVLSSAFPRAGEILFFPTPLRTPKSDPSGSLPLKTLKKVEYVSTGVFRGLLEGRPLTALLDETCLLQDRHALCSPQEKELLPEALRQHEARLWHIEQRPRVTIGRTQPDSTLYFTGRTSFNQGCGLWFAVRWLEDPAPQRPTLERLLADLEHAGLGGERAGGFGQALIRPAGSLDLPAPDDQPWVALSRCLPNAEDLPVLLDHRAAYRVEIVGGWVESPGMPAERRRSIRMLAEGSVLGPAARPAPGQVVDVQPDYGGKRPLGHPVWRNGLALAVGFTPGALEVNIP